jgi:hypothetical protein
MAILLVQVLHFIPDADDPYAIVKRLTDAVVPGSYLVIVHAPSDVGADAGAEIQQRCNQAMGPQIRLRSRKEVSRFFGGLELTGPGLISGRGWTPGETMADGTDVAGAEEAKDERHAVGPARRHELRPRRNRPEARVIRGYPCHSWPDYGSSPEDGFQT